MVIEVFDRFDDGQMRVYFFGWNSRVGPPSPVANSSSVGGGQLSRAPATSFQRFQKIRSRRSSTLQKNNDA